MSEAAQTIKFTDHFQDFLEWDLDAKGKVIECRPFQSQVWLGIHVVNHATLRKGSIVQFVRRGEKGGPRTIRYPLQAVRRARGARAGVGR
ncbi:MAG: hypothetical protein KF740_19915 [Ramlibacter sp.]|nr:hypothetical protein [Ramlibacter sp.]